MQRRSYTVDKESASPHLLRRQSAPRTLARHAFWFCATPSDVPMPTRAPSPHTTSTMRIRKPPSSGYLKNVGHLLLARLLRLWYSWPTSICMGCFPSFPPFTFTLFSYRRIPGCERSWVYLQPQHRPPERIYQEYTSDPSAYHSPLIFMFIPYSNLALFLLTYIYFHSYILLCTDDTSTLSSN